MASASSSNESDRAAVEHGQATERVRASLTHEERELFAFLRATCEHHCPEVVCRVAGGWVRDKILGVTSKDVDVALNMSGLVFAQHVNEELASSGLSAKRIGLIAAHPDKGKNLETVTMHLFDHMSVDFTNLRAPDGEIGCPRQDAFRRDLTINSLFYNINSYVTINQTSSKPTFVLLSLFVIDHFTCSLVFVLLILKGVKLKTGQDSDWQICYRTD